MEDLEKIEDLFFKMCDIDYVIVALELDENIRKFLKIKNVIDYGNSKYFIFNTNYGLKSGHFTDTIFNETLVDLIIKIR